MKCRRTYPVVLLAVMISGLVSASLTALIADSISRARVQQPEPVLVAEFLTENLAQGTCKGQPKVEEPLIPLPGHEFFLAFGQLDRTTGNVNEEESEVIPLFGRWTVRAWEGCIQISLDTAPKPPPKGYPEQLAPIL